MSANSRFYKNYDGDLLTLEVDRQGFVVGQSRIGYSRIYDSPAGMVDVLGGFTSIAVTTGVSLEDGAWLSQDVSSMGLTTKTADTFAQYDGERLVLAYDTDVLFDGYIESSALSATLDEDHEEQAAVSLVCRGFEAASFQLPPVNGLTRIWGTPENPGSGYTTARPAEKVISRVNAISGSATVAEDNLASTMLEERVGSIATLDGSQGSVIQDLAVRSGLLVDLGGTAPSFRSYQGVPHWQVTDADVSAYELATDQDTSTAMVLTQLENDTIFVAYQGRGNRLVERTVSSQDLVKWGLNSTAAQVPLKVSQDVYLSAFSGPFNSNVPLVARMPLKATFQHAGATYRGTVVRLSHAITPVRWGVTAEGLPVHMVTRRSDIFPTRPEHIRVTGAAGSFTVSWSLGSYVTADTAVDGTYVVLAAADAASVSVGDQVQVRKHDGTLRDARIFTTTAVTALGGGLTKIVLDGTMATASLVTDVLEFPDYGATATRWSVFYRTSATHPLAFPYDTLAASQVDVGSPTATISAAAGTYAVTVFAFTPDGYRSGPSRALTVTVT